MSNDGEIHLLVELTTAILDYDPVDRQSSENIARKLLIVRDAWLEEKRLKENALYELSLVRTNVENVWRWQAGEQNFPESLACPVVMSPDVLRGMLEDVRRAEKIIAAARAAIEGVGT